MPGLRHSRGHRRKTCTSPGGGPCKGIVGVLPLAAHPDRMSACREGRLAEIRFTEGCGKVHNAPLIRSGGIPNVGLPEERRPRVGTLCVTDSDRGFRDSGAGCIPCAEQWNGTLLIPRSGVRAPARSPRLPLIALVCGVLGSGLVRGFQDPRAAPVRNQWPESTYGVPCR